MYKAAQLVEALLAEGSAKDFLRSVVPTPGRWLEPGGFVKQRTHGGYSTYVKSRTGPRNLRSAIEVQATDPVQPSGFVTVQMNLMETAGETLYTQNFTFYWGPERLEHSECVARVVPLLNSLSMIPLIRQQDIIARTRLAFEDATLSYYQALADAAHARGDDEPEDEP